MEEIILNWANLIDDSQKQTTESYVQEGKLTFTATFKLEKEHKQILKTIHQSQVPVLFNFKGFNFLFEMIVNPNKIGLDNGTLCLFELPLNSVDFENKEYFTITFLRYE